MTAKLLMFSRGSGVLVRSFLHWLAGKPTNSLRGSGAKSWLHDSTKSSMDKGGKWRRLILWSNGCLVPLFARDHTGASVENLCFVFSPTIWWFWDEWVFSTEQVRYLLFQCLALYNNSIPRLPRVDISEELYHIIPSPINVGEVWPPQLQVFSGECGQGVFFVIYSRLE